ncbi:MAG: small basic protein [Planctomycetota bacterium]|jgi:small basic protein (TIGR04137 family)
MSIDRSLKIKGALSRHRNVLSRAERIDVLKDEERWEEGDAITGLPKVAHRKSHSGRKSEDAEKTEDQEAEAETPKAESGS